MMVFRATAIGGGGDAESGSTPLAVAGEDVSGIVLIDEQGRNARRAASSFDGAEAARR